MAKKNKVTQCDRVLDYIKKYGSITSYEAFTEIGCVRLASRISDLKKLGYNFKKERKQTKNRYGDNTHYDIYSLM